MLGKKTLGIAGATAALVIGMAGPALAEGNGVAVSAANQMRFEAPGPSAIGWQSVSSDSPLDTNSRALVMHVDAPDGFADAYTRRSLNINTPVGQLKNLSFEFDNTRAFTGGLRFSVIMDDGSVLFAPADACNNPETVRPTWSRADFTGNTVGNCTLFYGAETFSPDGTRSAWTNFAVKHPEQVVKYDFIINDNPGTTGATSVVDRISFGTNFLYNYSATRAVPCQNNENVC